MRTVKEDDFGNALLFSKGSNRVYLKLKNNPKMKLIGWFDVFKDQQVIVLKRLSKIHYNRNYRGYGVAKMLLESFNKCKHIMFVIDDRKFLMPINDVKTFCLTYPSMKSVSYGYEEQYFIPYEKIKSYVVE